ncbi:MAG: hypothetical protein ACXWDO_08150 [Bacteroidia bacterium]
MERQAAMLAFLFSHHSINLPVVLTMSMQPFVLKKNIYDAIVNLLFLALLALTIVFAEERLLADSGYYLLQVINNESVIIEHNRFILMLSQWLPLMAVKIGLPLKQVILLYSIGHWLFFYLIYLICRYVYKFKEAGFLLVLIQTLGIAAGFFTPMFELYYGAALLVLFAAILYHTPQDISNWILLLVLEFFAVSGHPFANFLLLFILALHAYQYRLKYIWLYLAFLLVLIGTFIFKLKTATEYEQGKSMDFFDTLQNGVYNAAYLQQLMYFLTKYYMEMLLVFLLPVIYFLIKRMYFPLAIYILTFFGLLALINVSYYGFEPSRYQEQVYFPLSFIVAYTFCIFVLKEEKNRTALVTFTVAVIIFRMVDIWKEGQYFRNRTETMKSLIDKAQELPGNKFVISEAYVLKKSKMDPNWSYSIETMLLSASNTNKTLTICTDADINFENNKAKIKAGEYLFRRWEIYPVNTLNRKYFNMQETDYFYLNESDSAKSH